MYICCNDELRYVHLGETHVETGNYCDISRELEGIVLISLYRVDSELVSRIHMIYCCI